MKKLALILALPLFMISCMKNKGEVSLNFTKAEAIYGDLDSLRALPLLIPTQPVVNPKSYFVSSQFVLIGELNKGIHIYDNLESQHPQRVSFIRIPNNKEFYVKDNFLYAETMYDVVKIDISDIYNPILVSRAENVFWEMQYNNKGQALIGFDFHFTSETFNVNSPEAKELKKSGTLYYDYLDNLIPASNIPSSFTGSYANGKGTMNRIAVDYHHVYIIGDSKLYTLSNFSGLNKSSEIKINSGTETIYTDNNRLYLGSTTAMTVYDASNPGNPKEVSRLEHAESCDPVLPTENIAYYTLRAVADEGCNSLGENTLNVVNVTNPQSMSLINSFELNSPYGMALAGNFLLVGEGDNGLTIFDASNRKHPEKKVTLSGIVAFDVMIHPTNPNMIIVSNNNGLQQIDINWQTLDVVTYGSITYN